MVVFNTEYIPEIQWITVETNSKISNPDDNNMSTSTFKSQKNTPEFHQAERDVQLILELIKLIGKMIKYNNIYYKKIEKRRQQQNYELQALIMFLQNICNDLQNVNFYKNIKEKKYNN